MNSSLLKFILLADNPFSSREAEIVKQHQTLKQTHEQRKQVISSVHCLFMSPK